MDEKRNCNKHGLVLFRMRQNKKGQWYVCNDCLKEQWRRAANKRRKQPGVKKYHQKYNKELSSIRKSLSVYLVMILLAANIKPE